MNHKFCTTKIIFVTLSFLVIGNLCDWRENVRPKSYVELGCDDVLKFLGNETNDDHFKIVIQDGNNLIVGGRNVVYNLSMSDLTEHQRLEWSSKEEDSLICLIKGISEDNCNNYIRVLAMPKPNELLVCGTNSFRPLCRTYHIDENGYNLVSQRSGQAISPYNPHHNSTFLFVDNELYSGTVADFRGTDSIIYREPLQTEQYDTNTLNEPNFVGSFAQDDFVYFLFRETALDNQNCGKFIISQVARVCKRDKGGPHRFRTRWTSYLRSRLNCSVPGNDPFYFNEIQSISNLVDGRYGNTNAHLIYGTFTTPLNSISGSAICAFSLQDITSTFEGDFKEQNSSNSEWQPVDRELVPDPRPGSCHNDSKSLPDKTLIFIKTHSLMNEIVPSYFSQPILIRTGTNDRFTAITVDPQIQTPSGKNYDIIFVGTDRGKIIKIVNTVSSESTNAISSFVIEEINGLAGNEPIQSLKIVRTQQYDDPIDGHYDNGKLVIVTNTQVVAIKLHRCNSNKIISCDECVALQDPYCAWDIVAGKCQSHGSPNWTNETYFYQHIETGLMSSCPPVNLILL